MAGRSAWGRSVVGVSDAVDGACTFGFVMATVAFGVIMLMGVFFRYVLNSSLVWSDEVALMTFIWATFLAIASGYLHGKHVNMDLLVRRLPSAWEARAGVVAEGLALGFLVSLTVSGIQTLPLAAGMRTDALRWPLTIPFLSIPVACLIMDLHWARRNLTSGRWPAAAVKLLIGGTFLFLAILPIGQYVQLTGPPRAVLLIAALFGPMLIGVPVALSLGFMATPAGDRPSQDDPPAHGESPARDVRARPGDRGDPRRYLHARRGGLRAPRVRAGAVVLLPDGPVDATLPGGGGRGLHQRDDPVHGRHLVIPRLHAGAGPSRSPRGGVRHADQYRQVMW